MVNNGELTLDEHVLEFAGRGVTVHRSLAGKLLNRIGLSHKKLSSPVQRSGWLPRGQRYRTTAPFGSGKTQTFIAGLRCHGLAAPWIVNAPFNKKIFELYVEIQLAPTLNPGDIVILDNVAFHKSTRAEE